MKYLLFVVCFIYIFSACSNNQNDKWRTTVDEFPVTKQVSLETVKVEAFLYYWGDMLATNDYLVSVDIKNDTFFQFFSLPDLSYLGSAVHRGLGPGEEMAVLPFLCDMGDGCFTYRSLDKIKKVSYNTQSGKLDLEKELVVPNKFDNILNMIVLDSMALGYDMLGKTKLEYVKYDFVRHHVEEFGPGYPKVDFLVEAEKRNVLFSKIMVAKPDNTLFASLYDKIPLLRIYNKEGKLVSETELKNGQVSPSIYGRKHKKRVDTGELTVNYLKIEATNNYVYGLYSGKTQKELAEQRSTNNYCKEIHVWDWDGNPVARFLLSESVGDFAVSPDDSYVFLYSYELSDHLYRFKLGKI